MSKQHTSVRAYGILEHEGRVLLVRSSSPQIKPPSLVAPRRRY